MRHETSAHSGALDHRPVHLAEPIAPLDVLALLRATWHGKWVILASLIVMLFLAGIYAFRIAAPQYAATVTMQLQVNAPMPGISSPLVPMDTTTLNTSVAQVTSDLVLTDVIDELGLLSDPEFNRYLLPTKPYAIRTLRTRLRNFLAGTSEVPPDAPAILDKTIQNLRGKLNVTRRPDTYLLRITARSGDPAKAALLVNTTAAVFLAQSDARDQQALTEAEHWLQSRVAELRQQLETQEAQSAALIATAQLQDDRVLDTLSADILTAEQTIGTLQAALTTLQQATDSTSARNIAEAAQLTQQIAVAAAQKERLGAQLAEQSTGRAELNQIQLQADATRTLYQNFLARLQENRLLQGLRAPAAQRITLAPDGTYIGPQKILILMIAALIGTVLGIGLVAWMHLTHKGFVDAQELRAATSLPVFAQFPNGALRRLLKGRTGVSLSPRSRLFQLAQGLYTAVSVAKPNDGPKVMLFTASVAAEGKTAAALAFSQARAAAGKRVVYISTDTGNATLQKFLGKAAVRHAQDSWSNAAEPIHHAASGVDILIAPDDPETCGVMVDQDLKEMILDLRQRYDHVIVDAPPILLAPSTLLLAQHADSILYTVRWSRTPRALVTRGLGALDACGQPATGLILTKINLRKMRKLSADPFAGAYLAMPSL